MDEILQLISTPVEELEEGFDRILSKWYFPHAAQESHTL